MGVLQKIEEFIRELPDFIQLGFRFGVFRVSHITQVFHEIPGFESAFFGPLFLLLFTPPEVGGFFLCC